MKAIQNLSIRNKFGIILFPLVAGIIYLAAVSINRNFQASQDLSNLQSAIGLSTKISAVVHEIQRERGVTAGYLTSKGELFATEITERRKATDKILNEYKEETERILGTDYGVIAEPIIAKQNEIFEELIDVRQKSSVFSISAQEQVSLLASVNDRSIQLIGDLTKGTENKEIYQQVNAYRNYLLSKERAGIERASLTSAFTTGQFSIKEDFNRFAALVTEQNVFLDNFTNEASEKTLTFFNSALEDDKLDKDMFRKVSEMRATALSEETFDVDPNFWFNMATGKINLLKEVEDYLASDIVSRSTDLSNQAQQNFTYLAGSIFLLGGLNLLLLFSVVRNILSNISTLESFSVRVAEGDFSSTPKIKNTDEIGRFAKVFNGMINTISIAQEDLGEKIKQSQVVFDNVDQGIFLLDEKFVMSDLYSSETEQIFNNDKISGESFIQFMRPRLVARDQDALEMFMKHLFNPEIEEEVVNKLNPIERVQIFSSNESGELSSKHIRVGFSRIQEGDRISSILVTVVDETETVLLQKEIEEAEGKNKQEMELMLSILRVDPATLEDFLNTCRQSLGNISSKYESDDKRNFKELVSFTYNTIHNLKANAGLIDLKVLADKFHGIEELLSKLQGKELVGDDFLRVLYEINEVNDVLENMQNLLGRILSVSGKGKGISNKVDDGSDDEKMIDSLQKGTERISQEMGKKVDLQFTNEDNVVIPGTHRSDLKDILLQLVRNSIVHGIETPEQRTEKNKPESGHINVTFNQNDDRLSVHYKDDGRGLDLDKIMRKALDENLVTQEEVASFGSKDIVKLLFKDGFSTAEEVNQHGGRGQGMSLVGRLIKKFGGDMKMNFKKDQSFEMNFSFPLTTSKLKTVA
ncbi:nitrate- and nitrite sensing domain-containing protein [Reichenbachiella sp.]|uniref:nitrate- and nitrite sensing domain-containing protein n=1 Tax=Reichenbachiella sp. TaxID=2184521 RepID=UPI00329A4BC7